MICSKFIFIKKIENLLFTLQSVHTRFSREKEPTSRSAATPLEVTIKLGSLYLGIVVDVTSKGRVICHGIIWNTKVGVNWAEVWAHVQCFFDAFADKGSIIGVKLLQGGVRSCFHF